MITMITAYTEEIDEVEDGIADIMRQIDLGALKKNSVGLITCHYDYTESGFLAELSKKLPFEFIGMSTMASANQHGQSMYAFSLTILTSDDVAFETALTGPLGPGDYHEKIKASYSDAAKKLNGPPSLILTFFPYIMGISGAQLHKSLDEICGGIPLWGSIVTNTEVSYEHCTAFRSGEAGKDGMAMILMNGPVDPEFVVISLPAQNIRENRGQITASDGCLLKEINGISPVKYLESIGIVIRKGTPLVTPLMVYYEGNTEPVAVAIYLVNDDESFLCGSEMTKGASITIGEISTQSILESAAEGIDRVLKTGKRGGALILPCVSRYVMLSPNNFDEVNLIAGKTENGNIMPFMTGYAGGEICPLRDMSGALQNRFHGFTFTACVF